MSWNPCSRFIPGLREDGERAALLDQANRAKMLEIMSTPPTTILERDGPEHISFLRAVAPNRLFGAYINSDGDAV